MSFDEEFSEITMLIRNLKDEISNTGDAGKKAELAKKLDAAKDLQDALLDLSAASAIAKITNKRLALEEAIAKINNVSLVPDNWKGAAGALLESVKAAPVSVKSKSELAEPKVTTEVTTSDVVTAPFPAPSSGPNTELTEAHLIGLFRRSQFPIQKDRLLVFGVRGCLPVNYGGTTLANSHFVKFNPPNYLTMMCTIGLWRPGKGFALFPGSTVPYGPDVNNKAAGGGDGVNQLGRGRYQKYFPGWHTSKQKEAGHWALRQGGPITLQRTSDAYPYDLLDKWQEGTIAGDNIHCARSMGPEGRIPESKYSSLGCQVVAGTVINGDHDSEAGPWATFIANFKGADAPKSVDYVLFDGAEVERMIADQNNGSSIILRFGSVGTHVAALQAQLAGALNRPISVDADFGVKTFRAVVDFQEEVFGPAADDGLVGKGTATKLGFELPVFDFKAVISGNEETTVVSKTGAVDLDVDERQLKPITDNPLLKNHFSTFTKRPSNAQKQKIYDTYLDYFKTPECWFWLEEFGICKTPERLAHFFAQAAHETGGFTITRENMRYTSVSAVKKAFGSRVRRKKYTDARLRSELLENPKAMANWAYNGRGGNRRGTDDGYNFRGGGIFQTTHRTGYRSVEKKLKKYGILVPLEQDPSLIVDPRISFPAACFEWKHLGANSLADANNIKAISRGLNRGKSKMHGSTPANGEADRIAKYKKIGSAFA